MLKLIKQLAHPIHYEVDESTYDLMKFMNNILIASVKFSPV